VKSIKVEIPGNGISLEGIFALPDGDGPFPLVVVCHPHPLYGGNMYNNVVHAVCEKLGDGNMASLKFNFRGVGGSGGAYAGGAGEIEDAKAAITFGLGQPRIEGRSAGLCGYSFGGMVAFSAAVEDERVGAVAGISPLVQPPDLLDHYEKPKLLVCGDQDEFIPLKNLEDLIRKIPEPKEMTLYPGVDHFWGGEDMAMAERVADFFKRYL
jgi:alpha/beta superfamily hydrolase